MKLARHFLRFFIVVVAAATLITLFGTSAENSYRDGSKSHKPHSLITILNLLLAGEKDIVANNDGPYRIDEDQLLTVASPGIVGNDVNAGSNGVVLVNDTQHGTLSLNESGSFSYLPNTNYWGPDSFSYKIVRGSYESNEATVSISISPVNDRPLADAGEDDSTLINETIDLDGSGSSDPESSQLSYTWSLTVRPPDSSAELAGSSTPTPSLTPDRAGLYTVELVVSDGILDSIADTITVTSLPLPPDPATIAPGIDHTVPTNTFTSTEFLYTGSNPIQMNVIEGAIELERSSVLRGKVITGEGLPLPGVTITISNHPEYGKTYSRDDGMFDMVVNGGGYLVVNYSKRNYLSAQRKVNVPWQDYVWVDDVALIQPAAKVNSVNLSEATSMESVQGDPTDDDRGSRQSTLMFQQGTTAELAFTDGTTQPISELSIRITEYTTGDYGRNAMPAKLPPGIGYTYCASISVDEALSEGASEVRFNKPVINYLDNFIGFESGVEVPVYYYDYNAGQWQQDSPGRVIEIISVTDGLANVDIDGDGLADNPASLLAVGINTEEREELAALYASGQSLWRTQLNHFSTIDYNYPYDYPDSDYPDPPDIRIDQTEDETCEQQGASVIECQNQVLGESIPITGTPFSLNYRSNRTEGRSVREIKIPIKAASCDFTSVHISVAGKLFQEKFPCIMSDYDYTYTWDGLDAYGREVQGAQPVSVQIAYWYQQKLCGRRYNPVTSQWDKFCRVIPGQFDVLKSDLAGASLNFWDTRGQGLGGWTLDVHHAYNAVTGSLFTGDGRQLSGSSTGLSILLAASGYSNRNSIKLGIDISPEGHLYAADWYKHAVFLRKAGEGDYSLHWAEVIAGQIGDTGGFAGDNGPAAEALLNNPTDVAYAQDGIIYISDTRNHRVRKVDEEGIITTFAGNGSTGSAGDGGLATEASLGDPEWLAVGPDGSLFVTTNNRRSIRRISPNGIIDTVFTAPSVTIGYSTHISDIWGLAVDGSGVLYASVRASLRDGYPGGNCIYMIMPDGTFSVIAGTGDPTSSGDGGLAIDATMNPRGLAAGSDGSIYLADINYYSQYDRRIRRISPDGFISSVAGCKLNGPFCDTNGVYNQELARNSFLNGLDDIALGPEQDIYFSTYSRMFKIDSPRPGLSANEIDVPGSGGHEMYTFSSTGKHLKTRDTLTGASLYTFTYTDQGALESIEDAYGNTTAVERDNSGNLQAIVGPHGHRTVFSVNSNGYIETATKPNNETLQFAYTDTGLLTSSTDAKNHTSHYTYDVSGRLLTDVDPGGGSWTLDHSETISGYEVTKTSGLNRTSSYLVETDPSGEKRWLNTFPGNLAVESTRESGSQTIARPDGVAIDLYKVSDPRFGIQAPVSKMVKIQTPGGITLQVDTSETVVLTDDSDPMSLQEVTQTKSVNGRQYVLAYDASTGEISKTSPEGRSTTTTIDSNGKIIKRKIGDLEEVNIGRDQDGRISSISQGGRTHTISYNNQGKVASITDPLSRVTAYEYDAVGQLTKMIFPDSEFVEYIYDANGNILSYAMPGGSTYNFSYTSVNRLNGYTFPNSGGGNLSKTFVYNLDRQVTSITRPDGVPHTFVYDTAGRLITNGGISYSYDSATGKLSSISTIEGSTLTFTFDGNLPLQSTWTGTVAGEVAQQYDNNLNIVSRSVNGANTILYTYDDDKLMTQAGAMSLTRDTANGFITATLLDTIGDNRSYDTYGKLASYSASENGTVFFQTDYAYDALGRISEINETLNSVPAVYTYSYDTRGRISTVNKDGSPVSSYTYDTDSNILSMNTTSGIYDQHDRLTSWGTATYAYTQNGELQSQVNGAETTTYTYDIFGNLKQVSLPDGTQLDYLVDGLNRRIGKRVDGVLSQGFLYEDELSPIAELDGSNNVVSHFIYATRANVPDYMIKNGETYRILSDHLGSPRLVIRTSDGVVVQQIDYDVYGKILQDSNPGFQPFGYAGGLYDADTRLLRFGGRDYDPQTGRWTARDSRLINGQGANGYAYAANNPLNFIDPSGKEPPADIYIEIPIYLENQSLSGEELTAYRTCSERYWRQRQEEMREQRESTDGRPNCASRAYRIPSNEEQQFLCAQSGECEEGPWEIYMRQCMWENWGGLTPVERERGLLDIITEFYQEHFTSQPEPHPTVGTGGGVRF